MTVVVPPGSPPSVRGAASVLAGEAAALQASTGRIGAVSAGINAVWRSNPSAPRAAGRLSAVTDLLRLWTTRLEAAADALRRYANALEKAQDAAILVNSTKPPPPPTAVFLPTSVPLSPHPPLPTPTSSRPNSTMGPPAPSVLTLTPVDVQNLRAFHDALAELQAADVTTAAALQAANSGEGWGASAVDARIADADAAADAGPVTLTTMLTAALARQPPDLPAVEEAIRQLSRKQNYPVYLQAVLTGLGPQLGVLIALPGDSASSYDADEIVGVLAVVASDLRAAGRPLARSSEEAICARLGISTLPRPAYTGR